MIVSGHANLSTHGASGPRGEGKRNGEAETDPSDTTTVEERVDRVDRLERVDRLTVWLHRHRRRDRRFG